MDSKSFMIRTAILVAIFSAIPLFINPTMKWLFFEDVESVEQISASEIPYDSPLLSKFQTNPKRIYQIRVQKVTRIVASDFLAYDTIYRFDTTFLEKKKYTTSITIINK